MSKPDLSTYGGKLRDLGYAGEVVNMHPNTIESKTNESATAIDYGIAVARGAADDTCKPPAADGDKLIGISVRHAIRPADSANNVVYNRYDSVPIMREGYIYVTAFENVTRDDQALSITAQGGKVGGVTGGAAGAGRVVIPNAKWETTTTAGNIGIVRISG
jgi:hypothetical protein